MNINAKKSIKFSQTKLKKTLNDHPLWSSTLHLCDAGMVQYTEIHQCNPLHKQTQRKRSHNHFIKCIWQNSSSFHVKSLGKIRNSWPIPKNSESSTQKTCSLPQPEEGLCRPCHHWGGATCGAAFWLGWFLLMCQDGPSPF